MPSFDEQMRVLEAAAIAAETECAWQEHDGGDAQRIANLRRMSERLRCQLRDLELACCACPDAVPL